jgi:hypothetical protein
MMADNLTGYELSRQWFDFCFENPDNIKPLHSAIYFFAIEHCNRLGWKHKFGFPSQMAMEALGIKNWRTYSKGLNDLVDWGFIEMVEISRNQYSSNIIAIVKNTKATTKALDKALSKHSQKQGTKHSQSTVSINKQVTSNKEQETINEDVVEFSENDIQFRDFLCKEFNISEMTQPRQFMDINQAIMFMNNQSEKINKHFRAQCWNYFTYKEAADEKKHSSINTFLFDPDHDKYYDRIMGGGWNKSNWYQLGKKISKSKYYEEGEDPEEILNYNK